MQNEGLQKLKDVFEKIYLIKDPYIVKVLCALVVAHFLKCDPVWAFILAPSGGCKTEFINAITDLDMVHPLSSLTARTFVSGAKRGDQETSLLVKITNGIITFEDFTTLASENKEEKTAIMGQLRSIYGGKFDKAFGTGQNVNWEGKITILAGATYGIYTFRELFSKMGERFLIYNLIQPDRIEAARRAGDNQSSGKIKEFRKTIQIATKEYLLPIIMNIPEEMPMIPPDLRTELLQLSELTTRARSSVERDWRSVQREITETYEPEMPTRFVAQLQTLAQSLWIINKHEGHTGWLSEDKEILRKFTFDSITKSKRICLQELARYQSIHTTGLATKLNFPTSTTRRWLEDLNALGLVDRKKGSGPKGDEWVLKEQYNPIIQKFEKIMPLDEELLEEVSMETDNEREVIDDDTAEKMVAEQEEQFKQDGLL